MFKNVMAHTSARLDRKALFARSEILHQLAADHVQALAGFLSPVRVRACAKLLARFRPDVSLGSDSQAVFVIELATWTADKGRSTALERYARQKILLPESDEAAVLAGMQASVISFWKVQESHPVGGRIVRELTGEVTVWVVDDGLEQYLKAGGSSCFLARLFQSEQDGFWMICSDVFGLPETPALLRAGGEMSEDDMKSDLEEDAALSRDAAYVAMLYAAVPPAAD